MIRSTQYMLEVIGILPVEMAYATVRRLYEKFPDSQLPRADPSLRLTTLMNDLVRKDKNYAATGYREIAGILDVQDVPEEDRRSVNANFVVANTAYHLDDLLQRAKSGPLDEEWISSVVTTLSRLNSHWMSHDPSFLSHRLTALWDTFEEHGLDLASSSELRSQFAVAQITHLDGPESLGSDDRWSTLQQWTRVELERAAQAGDHVWEDDPHLRKLVNSAPELAMERLRVVCRRPTPAAGVGVRVSPPEHWFAPIAVAIALSEPRGVAAKWALRQWINYATGGAAPESLYIAKHEDAPSFMLQVLRGAGGKEAERVLQRIWRRESKADSATHGRKGRLNAGSVLMSLATINPTLALKEFATWVPSASTGIQLYTMRKYLAAVDDPEIAAAVLQNLKIPRMRGHNTTTRVAGVNLLRYQTNPAARRELVALVDDALAGGDELDPEFIDVVPDLARVLVDVARDSGNRPEGLLPVITRGIERCYVMHDVLIMRPEQEHMKGVETLVTSMKSLVMAAAILGDDTAYEWADRFLNERAPEGLDLETRCAVNNLRAIVARRPDQLDVNFADAGALMDRTVLPQRIVTATTDEEEIRDRQLAAVSAILLGFVESLEGMGSGQRAGHRVRAGRQLRVTEIAGRGSGVWGRRILSPDTPTSGDLVVPVLQVQLARRPDHVMASSF